MAASSKLERGGPGGLWSPVGGCSAGSDCCEHGVRQLTNDNCHSFSRVALSSAVIAHREGNDPECSVCTRPCHKALAALSLVMASPDVVLEECSEVLDFCLAFSGACSWQSSSIFLGQCLWPDVPPPWVLPLPLSCIDRASERSSSSTRAGAAAWQSLVLPLAG